MKNEKIIVLDFGGQYNQLIARRVRECNVYCEIYSYKTDLEKIKEMQPKGIIFTGGPNSAYEADSPSYTREIFNLGVPILGICYGAQLMMHLLGGKVEKAPVREYGKIEVTVDRSSKLFENVSEKTICWMSHNDYISQAARFCSQRPYSRLSSSGSGGRGEKALCNPVPSRGTAYAGRY